MREIDLEVGNPSVRLPDGRIIHDLDRLVLFPSIGHTWARVPDLRTYCLFFGSATDPDSDDGQRWADHIRGRTFRNLAQTDNDWWLDLNGDFPRVSAGKTEWNPIHEELGAFAATDSRKNHVVRISDVHQTERHFYRFSVENIETVIGRFWKHAYPGPWIEGYCVPRSNAEAFVAALDSNNPVEAELLFSICSFVLISFPAEHTHLLLATIHHSMEELQVLLRLDELRQLPPPDRGAGDTTRY